MPKSYDMSELDRGGIS